MDITTIKLQKETKERLEKLKECRRESYDDILRNVLYVLNITRDNPNKAKLILERIDELMKKNVLMKKMKKKRNKRKIN
jgi:hypothetical protein